MFRENAEASNGADPAVAPQPPAAQRLAEIRVPTLVATADRDLRAIAEIADVLEREIPRARRVVISNADHLVPWREPRQLADALVAFLSG